MLKNFQELSLELTGVKKCRNKDYCQKLRVAMIMAQEAEQISIQERVTLFGFWSRYNGSDHSREGKDLMLSGVKGPDLSLEKEEDSDLEEEEEGKKGPTLPIPKPAKTQTKKPKARGTADRQDGAQQGKSMNRPLGNEPAAVPVPIKGRKEVHGSSDPDEPGLKKKFKAPQSKVSATSLSEGKEVRMVPKGLILPTHHGACPSMGREEPGSQELQEAGSFPSDDETSSGLDLEQLMEDVRKNTEQRVELQHRDDTEEFTFFEE
ncbi:zinc finger CW-type and PWWP domain containing 1 [Phyllostomus discolor]|nr:zinc finger CW-type and PWWP domain containing 1 [Phyllostomus discolor]